MIMDALIDLVYNFVMNQLADLPDLSIPFDISFISGFYDIIGSILYFLPWKQCLPILVIIVSFQVWRILISIIKTIWDVLPLV